MGGAGLLLATPFSYVFFDILLVSEWDFELLDVDWFLIFDLNVMHKGLGSAQIHLVTADGLMVLE